MYKNLFIKIPNKSHCIKFNTFRTILKTNSATVGEKNFHHFSLEDGLKRRIDRGIRGNGRRFSSFIYFINSLVYKGSNIYFRLDISVGIDGLSPYKSKKLEIWPIACRVINSYETNPFVVSLYAAEKKPESVEEFLRPFSAEMVDFQANGLRYKGKTYRVNLKFIVCDAIARQFVKQIIGAL